METSEDYYPRIEFVQDSLGNTWTPGQNNTLSTKNKLRPGDVISFIVIASDPLGESIETSISKSTKKFGEDNWTQDNQFEVLIEENDVMKEFFIILKIRSLRKYHARENGTDDFVGFFYEVLPPKNVEG